jgi:hypothetical protein
LNNTVSGRDPALRGAFVDAHILARMLRSPKGHAPWLTARYVLFSNRPNSPLHPSNKNCAGVIPALYSFFTPCA